MPSPAYFSVRDLIPPSISLHSSAGFEYKFKMCRRPRISPSVALFLYRSLAHRLPLCMMTAIPKTDDRRCMYDDDDDRYMQHLGYGAVVSTPAKDKTHRGYPRWRIWPPGTSGDPRSKSWSTPVKKYPKKGTFLHTIWPISPFCRPRHK